MRARGRRKKGCVGGEDMKALGMLCFFVGSVPMRARRAVGGGGGAGGGESVDGARVVGGMGTAEGWETEVIFCWAKRDE